MTEDANPPYLSKQADQFYEKALREIEGLFYYLRSRGFESSLFIKAGRPIFEKPSEKSEGFFRFQLSHYLRS